MTTTTETQPTADTPATSELADFPSSLEHFRAGKPGVYELIKAEDYHKLNACSSSRLGKLRRSAEHCLESMQGHTRTDDMVLGDAGHLFILQPELVESRYIVPELCCAIKKGDGELCGKNGVYEHEGEWYCGTHKPKGELIGSGRDRLTQDQCDKCVGMRDRVLRHPRARDLFETEGPRELSLVWVDKETDLLCKARIDKFNIATGTFVDLKTTPDARRKAFAKKIFAFSYFIQAPFYLDGGAAHGIDASNFIFVPVEKTPPFTPHVFNVVPRVMDAGRKLMRELMQTYAQCLDTGNWPGYGDNIEDIDLNDWDMRELEEGSE